MVRASVNQISGVIMPHLNLDENRAVYQIKAYKPGYIQVNEKVFTHSIVISAEKLVTDWQPQSITELTSQHLDVIAAMQPTILLLGTGTSLQFPDITLYGHLINQNIGVEIMDTSAACRTYNALTAENRNVVAALIIK